MNVDDCTNLRDRFSEYLDGELSIGDRARVDAHVTACATCRESLDSLREIVEDVRRYGRVPVPQDFAAGVRRRIEEAPSGTTSLIRRLPLVPLALAASLLVVLGLGLQYLRVTRHADLGPPPPEPSTEMQDRARVAKASPAPALEPTIDGPAATGGVLQVTGEAKSDSDLVAKLRFATLPPVENVVMERLETLGYDTSPPRSSVEIDALLKAGRDTTTEPRAASEARVAGREAPRPARAVPAGAARPADQKKDEESLDNVDKRERVLREEVAGPISDRLANFTFVVVEGSGGADLDRLVGLLQGNGQIIGSAEVNRPEVAIDRLALQDAGPTGGGGNDAHVRRVSVYEFQSRTRPEAEIADELEREFRGAVRGSDLGEVVAEARRSNSRESDGFRADASKATQESARGKESAQRLGRHDTASVDEGTKAVGAAAKQKAPAEQNEADDKKSAAIASPRLVILYRHPLDER